MILATPPPQTKADLGPLRFTLDGNAQLESHLADTCQTIMSGLRGLIPAQRLEAVLLGGGYGRGEGGVLQTDKADLPYNDLEFYIFLRGNRHLNEWRYHEPVGVLGEILSPKAGVEIEFKLTTLEELRRSPVSMFSHDLIMGHRWLAGHQGMLFGFTHHRLAERIPPAEGTRLLLNRCTGLLLARERLERTVFTAADADFVQRNQAKAALAYGDALLTAHGRYHWKCAERHRRLLKLAPDHSLDWLDEVRHQHGIGVQFKLHPVRSHASRAQLQDQQLTVAALGSKVWLWLESRRLGVPFASIGDYVEYTGDKCPETRRSRNVLVNLKSRGLRALLSTNPGIHPRQWVFDELCRLLWVRPISPPGLKPKEDVFRAQVSGYKSRWEQVN